MNSPARLRQLLDHFLRGTVDVEAFCAEFEQIYNLELDKRTLTPSEADAFSALFEQVVWYSPFEEERKQVPSYKSDDDIKAAAESAAARIAREPPD